MNDLVAWRGLAAVGTARFDFLGMLSLADVERGADPYAAQSPLGRDLTTQAHVGNELVWEVGSGTLRLVLYLSLTNMQLHEDLTGYALDVLAGLPPQHGDDTEQVNQATTYGLNVSYRHVVKILTPRDIVEVGAATRIDAIQQSDTRLNPDGTIYARDVDASIGATGIAGYLDAALYPIPRVVVRGGTRLDSLAYSVDDKLGNAGIERTMQGLHVGNKATVDYAAGHGVHLVGSYGEGFRSPEARSLAEGEKIPLRDDPELRGGRANEGSRPDAGLDRGLRLLAQRGPRLRRAPAASRARAVVAADRRVRGARAAARPLRREHERDVSARDLHGQRHDLHTRCGGPVRAELRRADGHVRGCAARPPRGQRRRGSLWRRHAEGARSARPCRTAPRRRPPSTWTPWRRRRGARSSCRSTA